jgi:hypothetical protein
VTSRKVNGFSGKNHWSLDPLGGFETQTPGPEFKGRKGPSDTEEARVALIACIHEGFVRFSNHQPIPSGTVERRLMPVGMAGLLNLAGPGANLARSLDGIES